MLNRRGRASVVWNRVSSRYARAVEQGITVRRVGENGARVFLQLFRRKSVDHRSGSGLNGCHVIHFGGLVFDRPSEGTWAVWIGMGSAALSVQHQQASIA